MKKIAYMEKFIEEEKKVEEENYLKRMEQIFGKEKINK